MDCHKCITSIDSSRRPAAFGSTGSRAPSANYRVASGTRSASLHCSGTETFPLCLLDLCSLADCRSLLAKLHALLEPDFESRHNSRVAWRQICTDTPHPMTSLQTNKARGGDEEKSEAPIPLHSIIRKIQIFPRHQTEQLCPSDFESCNSSAGESAVT